MNSGWNNLLNIQGGYNMIKLFSGEASACAQSPCQANVADIAAAGAGAALPE
jgi:hypothetical protein